MRRPNICADCTAKNGEETRHGAKRRCSTVQAQFRYRKSEKGRKANAAAVAAFRERQKDASDAS